MAHRREWPRRQAPRIYGWPIRAPGVLRETQATAGVGPLSHSQQDGEIWHGRVGNARNFETHAAPAGRTPPESRGVEQRPFDKGFRGCSGFVGHTELFPRPFFLAAPWLHIVSLSMCGSRSVTV